MHDPRDDDSECPICGGEGFVFDCFDGCCEDAEIGCDECTIPCDCQKRPSSPELQEVLREALSQSPQPGAPSDAQFNADLADDAAMALRAKAVLALVGSPHEPSAPTSETTK